MFKDCIKLSIILALLLGAHQVQAVECQLDTYTLTSISADGVGTINIDQDATDCAGLFGTPQSPSNDHPDPNIGTDSNGLLNGEYPDLFDPVAEGFITEDDLQNLNDTDDPGLYEGLNDDPGWIFLAGEDGDTIVGSELTIVGSELVQDNEYGTLGDEYGEGLGTLNLSDVVDISITCNDSSDCKTGTWSVEVLEAAYDLLPPYVGNNIFDHLTFVVSAGGYWGIFDFNTAEIFGGLGITYPEPGVFEPAFTLSGEFDLYNFGPTANKGAAVSHWSVHARDPGDDSAVPAPGVIYLLAIGLFGFSVSRKLMAKAAS